MSADELRASIRAEIAAPTPLDTMELAHRNEALAWLDAGAPLWRLSKPATPPQHLVSYFVLVDGEHLLLVDHKLAGLWLPTGGHVDPGEHPRDTVARELHEELGLALPHAVNAPVFITCSDTVGLTAGHRDVSLWYLLRVSRETALQTDPSEFVGLRWFRRDELPLDRCDPHLARFANKLWKEIQP